MRDLDIRRSVRSPRRCKVSASPASVIGESERAASVNGEGARPSAAAESRSARDRGADASVPDRPRPPTAAGEGSPLLKRGFTIDSYGGGAAGNEPSERDRRRICLGSGKSSMAGVGVAEREGGAGREEERGGRGGGVTGCDSGLVGENVVVVADVGV